MSMVVKVSVVVRNLYILKKAVHRMGYTFSEILENTRREKTKASGNRIGAIVGRNRRKLCYVAKTADGYSLEARVQDYRRYAVEGTLDRIKQAYALEEVMKTARENGWTALSQTEHNGTVRIRLAV